jgi:dipeptidyl aminopeptidase/acylaminoacyl peptidase
LVPSGDVDARLAELSEWAAAVGPAPLTHRYGAGPEHEADLRLPAGGGPHPVAVLVHGGFWGARYTRTTMGALAVDLAKRGWASWNVEYRRMGSGGGVPETAHDLRGAIDALADVRPLVDRTRVVLIGHSAGGQLALSVAGLPSVAAVVSLAGVCDLASAARERIGDGAARRFMAGTPEERPAAYALADPIRLLPTGTRTLIVHGDADDRVPVQQSRDYARAARAAGDRCELLELPGVEHFALIDPRTPAWATVAERLEALMIPAR